MKKNQISPSEWEIMRVIWTNHPITSKEINEMLKEKTTWEISTTKTLIGRLVNKGMIDYELKGRMYVYYPTLSEKECIRNKITELFNQVCGTENKVILKMILEDIPLSLTDIESVEAVIEEKKKTAPAEVVCECVKGQCHCSLNRDLKSL